MLEQKNLVGRVKPVALLVTNGGERSAAEQSGVGRTFVGTVLDPASTLVGVGTVNERQYRRELYRQVQKMEGIVLDNFRLDYRNDRFPLGWMLAPQTTTLLDARIHEVVADEALSELWTLMPLR
jgi:hypothetical protein